MQRKMLHLIQIKKFIAKIWDWFAGGLLGGALILGGAYSGIIPTQRRK